MRFGARRESLEQELRLAGSSWREQGQGGLPQPNTEQHQDARGVFAMLEMPRVICHSPTLIEDK